MEEVSNTTEASVELEFNANIPLTMSTTTSIGITQIELWIQMIIFFGLLGGILSTIGHILLAIGILRCKKLRSRFFVILWCLVILRLIFSIEFVIIFLHRILRTLNVIDLRISRLACYLFHFQNFYAMTLEMVLMLGLVIDRSIAILGFNYYRLLTNRQAAWACIIASVVTIIFKIVPSVIGVNFNEDIDCINGYSPVSAPYLAYHQNIDLAIAILILVLYVGLLLYLHCRLLPKMKANQNTDQANLIAFRRQMKLLPLLRRLVLIHCGFALATKIILSISGFMPADVGLRFSFYGGVLLTVDIFANVVMLLMSNKDLKHASLPCFYKNTVSSMATVVPTACPATTGRRRETFEKT